ncbi:MAG: multiheme c-type cytochrome [Polyangiaceae bacterium]
MRAPLAALLLLAGCHRPRDERQAAPPAEPPAAPVAVLPAGALPFAPAQVELAAPRPRPGQELAAAVEGCETCHADAAAQWRSSPHATASFDNPIYRVSVEGFREARGERASRMCGACHDAALLLDGAMDQPIAPSDPRARAGVTCLSCHGVEATTPDGNGSYRLRLEPPPVPVPGDAASLRAHRAAVAPAPLAEAALCGSCHRSFLDADTGHPHHLVGMDDFGAHQRSVYAGSRLDRVDAPLPEQGCRDCHMPREVAPLGDAAADAEGIRSHRFAGGHTWLAAMRGDEAQLAATRAMLRRAAAVELVALRRGSGEVTLPADGAAVSPGEVVVLEGYMRNLGAGHRFPGGTRDAQETWVEVEVRDGEGELVAETDPATPHRLAAAVVDDDGAPVLRREVHRFMAPGYDATLAPRDRGLLRYELVVPEKLALPLEVRIRIVHQSREPALVAATCAEARSPRGLAYRDAVIAAGRRPLDACVAPPRTVVAEHRVRLGGAPLGTTTPLAFVNFGAAWGHGLVEETDRARLGFEAALAAKDAPAALRASAHHGLAGVAAQQGRIDEMELELSLAEALVPGHPAYAWVRGRAYASVWRLDQAIRWLRAAAAAAPRDDRVWALLATQEGSAGRPDGALAAARQGLRLLPRGEDLLRAQALALRVLDPGPRAESAFAAYLAHRAPDAAPELRSRCSNRSADCARERRPGHLHRLVAPRP